MSRLNDSKIVIKATVIFIFIFWILILIFWINWIRIKITWIKAFSIKTSNTVRWRNIMAKCGLYLSSLTFLNGFFVFMRRVPQIMSTALHAHQWNPLKSICRNKKNYSKRKLHIEFSVFMVSFPGLNSRGMSIYFFIYQLITEIFPNLLLRPCNKFYSKNPLFEIFLLFPSHRIFHIIFRTP